MTNLEQKAAVLMDVLQEWLTTIAERDSHPGELKEVMATMYKQQMLFENGGAVRVKDGFDQLKDLIVKWGYDKGIIQRGDAQAQMLKCVAEVGELADGVATSNTFEIVDGVGDVLVTLILLCEIKGINLVECVEVAYEEIKNRNGSMIGGVFVKDGKVSSGV